MDDTPHTDKLVPAEADGSATARTDRLLGVSEVMARYGLRDRRTARQVMDAAGAFVVARRLFVRKADLVAYEDALRAARQQRHIRPSCPDGRRGPASTARDASPKGALAPGWWRTDGG